MSGFGELEKLTVVSGPLARPAQPPPGHLAVHFLHNCVSRDLSVAWFGFVGVLGFVGGVLGFAVAVFLCVGGWVVVVVVVSGEVGMCTV